MLSEYSDNTNMAKGDWDAIKEETNKLLGDLQYCESHEIQHIRAPHLWND